MTPSNFVFFLPRTDDAAGKKTVLLIEKASENDSPVLTELGSIKRAVAIIHEIRATVPTKVIAVDTACSIGRDLLSRSESCLKFNKRGYDPLFFLSQLFFLVRDKMPTRILASDRAFVDPVINLLHAARSNGGRRPCTVADLLIAELGVGLAQEDLPQDKAERLVGHPIGQVLRFFAEKSRNILGNRTRFDPDNVQRGILKLATALATLHQSPFPIDDDHWLSVGNVPKLRTDRTRLIDDFIFGVLDGSTHTRNSLREHHPIPSRIVRATNEFLTAVDLWAVPIFHGSIGNNRYGRIRGILDLIFKTWALALYVDCDTKPQIVDLSLLRVPVRDEFERTILEPLL